MQRLFRVLVLLVTAVLAVGVAFLLVAYRAAKQEPEFYQQALQVEPETQEEAGDQLEKQVLDLHTEVREEGTWEAVFTDEQINGWLAIDLPEKFPQALPGGVSEPRVAITAEFANVACRFSSSSFSTVISLAVAVHIMDQPNVVAVQIQKIRAGSLPLPTIEQWKERIEQIALKAGVSVRWAKTDGQDVALLKLPMEHRDFKGRQLKLETIELRDGEVYLAGRTGEPEEGGELSKSLQTATKPGLTNTQ